MQFHPSIRSIVVVGALGSALVMCRPATASYEALDAPLTKELERLEAMNAKAAAASNLPKDFEGAVKDNGGLLATVRGAKSPLVRLYRLRDATVAVESINFVIEHQASAESLEAFQKFWATRKSRFESKPKAPAGPILRAALSEAATNRATKLFYASLPYGKVSSPMYGLYYAGEAEGNLAFRRFLDSLVFDDTAETPGRANGAQLIKATEALDAEALELFAGDPVGRTAIPVSARLKEAHELLDSNRLDGATLAILEARLGASRRKPKPATPPTPPPASDQPPVDSIDALYVAIAAEGDAETQTFVRRDVLPLYHSLTGSSR